MNYPREAKYAPRIFMYKDDVVQKDNFTQRKLNSVENHQDIAVAFQALCVELSIIGVDICSKGHQKLLHDLYLKMIDYHRANFGVTKTNHAKNIFIMYVKLVCWCQLNKNVYEIRILMANLLNIASALECILLQEDKEKFKTSILTIFSIEEEILRENIVVHHERHQIVENENIIEEYMSPIIEAAEQSEFQPDNYNWTQECGKFLLWATGLDVHFKRQEILKQRLEVLKEERLLTKRFTV